MGNAYATRPFTLSRAGPRCLAMGGVKVRTALLTSGRLLGSPVCALPTCCAYCQCPVQRPSTGASCHLLPLPPCRVRSHASGFGARYRYESTAPALRRPSASRRWARVSAARGVSIRLSRIVRPGSLPSDPYPTSIPPIWGYQTPQRKTLVPQGNSRCFQRFQIRRQPGKSPQTRTISTGTNPDKVGHPNRVKPPQTAP